MRYLDLEYSIPNRNNHISNHDQLLQINHIDYRLMFISSKLKSTTHLHISYVQEFKPTSYARLNAWTS